MFLLQLLQQRIKLVPYGLFDVDLGLFSMVSGDDEIEIALNENIADYRSSCDLHSHIDSV